MPQSKRRSGNCRDGKRCLQSRLVPAQLVLRRAAVPVGAAGDGVLAGRVFRHRVRHDLDGDDVTSTVWCDPAHRIKHAWATVTGGVQCLKCEVAVLAPQPDPPTTRRRASRRKTGAASIQLGNGDIR